MLGSAATEPVTGYRGDPHPISPRGWTDKISLALALTDSIASPGWDRNGQFRR